MQLLGSIFFTSFLFAWTLCYGIVFAIVCTIMPFHRRFALARFWGVAILKVLQWTCRLDYRVEGLERLPPGGHVALWKHASSWETIAMSVIFPRQVWVLKRELLWLPFVGWSIKLLHAIAIDRSSGVTAVRQIVDQGKARIAEGDWVMIFPEGTRMALGQTRKYGISGALLAREAGTFVIPVAHDAGYYWPRRGWVKKPGTVRVVVGPPIATAGREPRAINDEAQAWIEATIQSLRR
jgi:1-acyl-sn-glycerol-3-phosphate acyltransferase